MKRFCRHTQKISMYRWKGLQQGTLLEIFGKSDNSCSCRHVVKWLRISITSQQLSFGSSPKQTSTAKAMAKTPQSKLLFCFWTCKQLTYIVESIQQAMRHMALTVFSGRSCLPLFLNESQMLTLLPLLR